MTNNTEFKGSITLKGGGRMWKDNIRMDLREIGWVGVDCIRLTQDTNQWRALVNTVINMRVP